MGLSRKFGVSMSEPIDPTLNVKELVALQMTHIHEVVELHAYYQSQLQTAEAKRLDAIRAVDVNAVSVASERATQQASVLANQVAASADTLRSLVATTATTIAQQLSQITTQLADRIAAVEKANYEGRGRQGISTSIFGWIGGLIAGAILVGFAYLMGHR
jgi:hypothetical protein